MVFLKLNASWRHQLSFPFVLLSWCVVHGLGDPSSDEDHGDSCIKVSGSSVGSKQIPNMLCWIKKNESSKIKLEFLHGNFKNQQVKKLLIFTRA